MRGRTLSHGFLALLVASAFVVVSPRMAAAVGAVPAPPTAPVYDPLLDDATRKALELERTVSDLGAEQTAIESRIQVTSERIFEQTTTLDRAERELRSAQTMFNDRAVAMYKFTGYDELSLLLSASSWQDLVTRVAVISHILDVDRRALEEASVITAQARYQATALDGIRAQDTELRQLKEQRVRLISTALTEQEPLVASLPAEGGAAVATLREEEARLRKEWRDSSIPLTTQVHTVPGKVLPYTQRTYLVSEFHPRKYRASGVTFSSVCAWYGSGFDGRPTGSGQLYNDNDLTCASRTLAFGTALALTRADKHVIVIVTNRGPYVVGHDLDLSRAAVDALGITGEETVQAEVVTRQ